MKFSGVSLIVAVVVMVLMAIIIYLILKTLEVESFLLGMVIIMAGIIIFSLIGAWFSMKKSEK